MTLKIIRVPISTPTLWPNTEANTYLIGNVRESLLVDAAFDQPETRMELEKAIQKHGLAIPNTIVLTHSHRDHAPGVKQLQHWFSKVYCHKKEIAKIKMAISPIDSINTLEDGDTITVANTDITILHTPGHSQGHVSLYIPNEKVLLAGDNIVTKGTTWIGPPEGNMSDYLQSLKRLKNLDISKIGTGHGDWVLDPYEKIDFIINRRIHRETQIQVLLKEKGPLTLTDITNLIYEDRIHPSIFQVAMKTVEAHLIKLTEDGQVQKEEDVYSLLI